MRNGYTISGQEVIFRAAEPWRADVMHQADEAVELTQGCTTMHGKRDIYTPEFGLVFRDAGRLARYDVGSGVNLRNVGAWIGSASRLQLRPLSFRKESGGNPNWDGSESLDALRQDGDFNECMRAYSKVLSHSEFSEFKALVGAPR